MIHHARNRDGKVINNIEDILYWMQYTNQSYEIIESLIKNETWMSSHIAMDIGFVQYILNSTSNEYKENLPYDCVVDFASSIVLNENDFLFDDDIIEDFTLLLSN